MNKMKQNRIKKAAKVQKGDRRQGIKLKEQGLAGGGINHLDDYLCFAGMEELARFDY